MHIAVLGLGLIGSIWAKHWLADGHPVRAWNRTKKPDVPGFSADPLVAVREAEVVAIVVSDGPAVQSVIERIAPVLRPGMTVCQHSTIGRDETLAAAKLVQATGAGFLDMPFTGSKTASENRQVVWYIGDDAGCFAGVEAVYQPLARAFVPIGGIGQAMAMKLAMNLNIAGVYQALAEAVRLAGAAGIAPERVFSTLALNVGHSGVADLKKPKILASDWSPHFAVKHMRKDLQLALRLARASGLGLPQTIATEAAYGRAEELGLAESDFSSLIETVRAEGKHP